MEANKMQKGSSQNANEEAKKMRSIIVRDAGMTMLEFEQLSREEMLKKAKEWEGRTKEFDAAKQYQFSYSQFCDKLIEFCIANVSRQGWMYVEVLDKHKKEVPVVENGKNTIHIDMSKEMDKKGKTVHVARETWEKWQNLVKDSGMHARVLDAVLCDYIDKFESGTLEVVTKVL